MWRSLCKTCKTLCLSGFLVYVSQENVVVVYSLHLLCTHSLYIFYVQLCSPHTHNMVSSLHVHYSFINGLKFETKLTSLFLLLYAAQLNIYIFFGFSLHLQICYLFFSKLTFLLSSSLSVVLLELYFSSLIVRESLLSENPSGFSN